jgi:hypothetical protein
MSNELRESSLPWLRKGDVGTTFWPQDNESDNVDSTRQVKTVRPSAHRGETVMMAFLPLTSVLPLDQTLLRLGKASHHDLPAQILPFPP